MIYFAYIRNRNIKVHAYTENPTILHELIEVEFNKLNLTNYVTRLDLLYSNIYCYEIDLDKQAINRIDRTNNETIDEYQFDNANDGSLGSYEDLMLGEILEILNKDLGLNIDLDKFKWGSDDMKKEYDKIYDFIDRLDEEYFTNGCLKASDDTYYINPWGDFVNINEYYGLEGYVIQKSKEHYDYSCIYLIEVNGCKVTIHDIFSGYNPISAICIYKCKSEYCDELRCLTVRYDIWHNDKSDYYWEGLYELLSEDSEIVALYVNMIDSHCIHLREVFEHQIHIDSYMRYSPRHRYDD